MAREKKISANFKAKEQTVAEIQKAFTDAKSAVFMDYRGITVEEVSALRSKFRASGVVYKVYKNNLVRIALNNLGVTALDNKLTGTLAVAFSNQDEITAAKLIQEAKFKDKMAFKFGLIGKSELSAADVGKLATMPSKETLVAQLMGLIQSGARNLATVVQAVPRNLAMVVDARSKQLA